MSDSTPPKWLFRILSYLSAFNVGLYTAAQFKYHEDISLLNWTLTIGFGVVFWLMSLENKE